MKIREELILKALAGEETKVELAAQYGVSRKTLYKWLDRYKERGLAGLVDESRRPRSSPMMTSPELALAAMQLRKAHPSWGPKKVVAVLARQYPGEAIPSVSTTSRIQVVRSRPGHPQDNGAHERMHVDVRFDLEDFAAATLPDQQHAFDDCITTFNQVRPHEALGQAKIDRQGWIRCEGLRVYISYALGGWTVGLQRVADGSTRVWFFRVLLGAFVPGRDTTIQPCAVDAVMTWHRRQFRIIDTAGIRRPGRVARSGNVEMVSVLLARRSIEAADVSDEDVAMTNSAAGPATASAA